MLTVLKFGGSSVADAGRIRRVAEIIAEKKAGGGDVVAVLSACGDTTDELTEKAETVNSVPPPRELDALLSTGEIQSTALMAMQLRTLGIPAVSLSGRQAGILTDSNHGSAEIININPARIRQGLAAGKVVVVAGFQGADAEGNITTLGRGGSDTTAVALAVELGAQSCEIYSDVEGVFTADPRLVTGARLMGEIDCRDMLALALGGSQVLHSRAAELAMHHKIEVRLLSSFTPGDGTVMHHLRFRPALCGITRDKAENRLSLVGRTADVDRLCEMAAVLRENSVPVLAAETHEGVCSVVTEEKFLLPALQILHLHFFSRRE